MAPQVLIHRPVGRGLSAPDPPAGIGAHPPAPCPPIGYWPGGHLPSAQARSDVSARTIARLAANPYTTFEPLMTFEFPNIRRKAFHLSSRAKSRRIHYQLAIRSRYSHSCSVNPQNAGNYERVATIDNAQEYKSTHQHQAKSLNFRPIYASLGCTFKLQATPTQPINRLKRIDDLASLELTENRFRTVCVKDPALFSTWIYAAFTRQGDGLPFLWSLTNCGFSPRAT